MLPTLSKYKSPRLCLWTTPADSKAFGRYPPRDDCSSMCPPQTFPVADDQRQEQNGRGEKGIHGHICPRVLQLVGKGFACMEHNVLPSCALFPVGGPAMDIVRGPQRSPRRNGPQKRVRLGRKRPEIQVLFATAQREKSYGIRFRCTDNTGREENRNNAREVALKSPYLFRRSDIARVKILMTT